MWGFHLDVIYLGLNLLLLLVFYLAGKNIQCGRNYWKNAWPCIWAFTFVMGARYMRGVDYQHYLDVYKNDLESTQEVYTFFCRVMKFMGINEYGSFFIYALVFSLCLFIFLKHYKKYAHYLFPLSLIFLSYFHEFMIRQAFGYSFIFLFLSKLEDIGNKASKLRDFFSRSLILDYIICFVLLIVIAGIHSANILIILLLVFCFFLIRKPVPLFISIPLLFFSTFFFSKWFDFGSLAPIMSYLGSVDDKFTNYAEHYTLWFDSDAMSDIYTRNSIIKVLDLLGNMSFFILSYKAIDKYENTKMSVTLYNCAIFGTLFQLAFLNLEVMNRMGYSLKILLFFPLALVFYYKRKIVSKEYLKLFYFFLVFLFYDYMKNLVYRASMTKFLWDM